MKLHLPSVLASAGLVGLVALLSSQSGPLVTGTIRLAYVPDPRTLMTITEGTPFVVPANKKFVLTALGTAPFESATRTVVLKRNNVTEVSAFVVGTNDDSSGTRSSQVPTQLAFSAEAGSTLSVEGGAGINGRAWGALIATN